MLLNLPNKQDMPQRAYNCTIRRISHFNSLTIGASSKSRNNITHSIWEIIFHCDRTVIFISYFNIYLVISQTVWTPDNL